MLAGIVPVSQKLSLQVALIVQGVDVEFGDVATRSPFQRFDIFDADMSRVESVLENFPRVRVGRSRRKVKLGDTSLLVKGQAVSSKDTSED